MKNRKTFGRWLRRRDYGYYIVVVIVTTGAITLVTLLQDSYVQASSRERIVAERPMGAVASNQTPLH
jgi:hypothetical protein